jgi:hypothetical protein
MRRSRKCLITVLTFGVLGQFGGCDLGTITTTTTLDGREVIISLVRSALINPLDAFITDRVNDLFTDEDE